MKTNTLIILLAFICFISSLKAQDPPTKEERIKAVKVAYIIEEIGLSSEQSQNFWPLYNELQAKIKDLNKKNKDHSKIDDMSDAEIEKWLNDRMEAEENKIALHRAYIQKFKAVISIRQIALLQRAEKRFKKELLRRARERKGNQDGNNGRRRDKF
ncbi:MAG: hypothetical protein MK207_07040 [Saprospiraceae bacterium]|nr:hypothetical protein [Saprospiraceae bacterium]